MEIVKEAFKIEDDMMTKLATGEWRRIGGVVRVAKGPNKGQIVKHLEPVESAGTKALRFVKNNKKTFVISTVAAVTITTGGIVYHKMKNREPKVVKKYHEALREYINDIRNGNLSVKSIDCLMDALEQIEQDKNYEKIKIELDTEELNVLVDRIYEYTTKLFSDNLFELKDNELNSSGSAIMNLQKCLGAQKRLFELAA